MRSALVVLLVAAVPAVAPARSTDGVRVADIQADYSPTWAPDGLTIAFVTLRDAGGPAGVYAVGAAGGEPRPISRKDFDGIDTLEWSPRRRELLVVDNGGGLPGFTRSEVGVLDESTGVFRNLSRNRANDDDATWSPGGEFIAFSSARTGKGDIYVMRRDGTGLRRMTRGPPRDVEPVWSPNGSFLVVRRIRSDTAEDVVVVNRSTGKARTLATLHPRDNSNRGSWHPDWSRDGRTIAVDIGARITFLDVRSGRRRPSVTNASDPRFSPDGKLLLVNVSAPRLALAVIPTNGIRARPLLSKPPAWAIDASWSRDGRRVALVRIAGKTSATRGLFVVGRNGKGLRRIL